MGSLSTLRLSFANTAIRTEQPAAKKMKQSLFGQGVMGVRYCGGLRLASSAAIGPPCSHRQGSPDFTVSLESMASVGIVFQDLPRTMGSVPASMAAAIGGFSLLLLLAYFFKGGDWQRQGTTPTFVPCHVPGVSILGNLHQLKEKKPHKKFAKWAETYDPVYSIKTSASTVVVLNSAEVAKEAMVTRYSSISSRQLPKALDILTSSKCMVAMSDYDEFYKMVKRYVLNNILGPSADGLSSEIHWDVPRLKIASSSFCY